MLGRPASVSTWLTNLAAPYGVNAAVVELVVVVMAKPFCVWKVVLHPYNYIL